MKLNWSFLNQTLLSLTLLTSATLSAQAEVLTSLNVESELWSNSSTTYLVDRSNLILDRANNQETLLISAGLKNRYNHYSEDNSTVNALIVAAADAAVENSDADNVDQGFLSKKTAKVEFIFALLIIVVSLIVSEKFQRHTEKQQSKIDRINGTIATNTTEQKRSVEK